MNAATVTCGHQPHGKQTQIQMTMTGRVGTNRKEAAAPAVKERAEAVRAGWGKAEAG